MKSAVITIKSDPILKKEAQLVAESLGFGLSTLLNAYMRELIATKMITFSCKADRAVEQDAPSAESKMWMEAELANNTPPYDWGKKGIPFARPVRYEEGKGFIVEE